MELQIKETRWAINRMTGEKTERVAEMSVVCEVGEIEELATEYKRFTIESVGSDFAVVKVNYLTNPDANKELTVKMFETTTYAPRSYGAGYVYQFELL